MKTARNFYLGVKSIQDAIDELSFIRVLDKSSFQVQIYNDDRITLKVWPGSKDYDLSGGFMIYIGGSFTSDEINEISNLSEFADKVVTNVVAEFVAKQAVSMQRDGKSATHVILGQS